MNNSPILTIYRERESKGRSKGEQQQYWERGSSRGREERSITSFVVRKRSNRTEARQQQRRLRESSGNAKGEAAERTQEQVQGEEEGLQVLGQSVGMEQHQG